MHAAKFVPSTTARAGCAARVTALRAIRAILIHDAHARAGASAPTQALCRRAWIPWSAPSGVHGRLE